MRSCWDCGHHRLILLPRLLLFRWNLLWLCLSLRWCQLCRVRAELIVLDWLHSG